MQTIKLLQLHTTHIFCKLQVNSVALESERKEAPRAVRGDYKFAFILLEDAGWIRSLVGKANTLHIHTMFLSLNSHAH